MSLAASIQKLIENSERISIALFCENHSIFLEDFYAKTLTEEEILQEGNLGSLLLEQELDQSDIEQLRTQSSELESFLGKVLAAPNLPGAANTWFSDQVKNTKLANNLAAKMDLAQPESTLQKVRGIFGKKYNVTKALKAIALIDQQASAGLAAFSEALSILARNLEGRIDGDIKLIDVDPASGITKEDIASGIQKAFQKSAGNAFAKKWKSLGKKLGSNIPGASISEFPTQEVMPQLMELTMDQLNGLVDAIPLKDIPPTPEGALSDVENAKEPKGAGSESADEVTLSDGELGQAAQAWLDKLKADGANADLMAIGKKWIANVSNDKELADIVSGELENTYESLNLNSLRFLITEQNKVVKWEDLLRLFAKNAPSEIGTRSPEVLEPIIAPFAQAMADVNVGVVDKNGKPYKPSTADTSDAIEDAEEEVADAAEESEDGEGKKVNSDILNKIFAAVEGLKDPKTAVEKFISLFDLKLEENKSWSLYDLLQEKVVKYEDFMAQLEPHFPENSAERIKAVNQLRDSLKSNLGDEYDITEIPDPEEAAEPSEEFAQELRIYKNILAPTDSFIREAQNSAVREALVAAGASEEVVSLFMASDDVEKLLENQDFVNELEAIGKAGVFEKARDAAYASIFDSAPEIMQVLSGEFGEEAVSGAADLWGRAQNAFEDISPEDLKELMDTAQSARGGSADSALALLKALANKGAEGAIRENLPEELLSNIFGEETPEEGEEGEEGEEEAPELEVEIGQFYEYENSKGEKIFVKITEENPNEGVWQVVKLSKDGKSWLKPTQSFAAKEEKFIRAVEGEEVFGETKAVKRSDFNSKISSAFDDVYGQDEELLDLVVDYDDQVPAILAKVSQELFSSDFSLEESLLKRKLMPFLFEGEYGWEEVQKSIDQHAGEVPKDLLYALFAKAIPSFEELGVTVSGVPEVDVAALKSSLSPDEEDFDPNAELDIEDPDGLSVEEEEKLDQEAEKVASTMGSIPIDKNKLASILKQYPDIVGAGQKATRARRKLRQAINIAAGMKVFAEEFDLGSFDENKYILNENKDYDAVARWKKLAGIKDD